MDPNKKKEIEDEIKRLQGEIVDDNFFKPEKEITPFDKDYYNKASAPIGHDKIDTIKKVVDAKKKSEQRAGLVKNSSEGSVHIEDYDELDRIPKDSIHDFENTLECICRCHQKDKKDCMYCYDHPVHLDAKRPPPSVDELDGYDETKIMKLIEDDKAKKTKKHWWQR